MRKVLFALLLTAVGLGLLLSFKSRPVGSNTSALGGSALSGAGEKGGATSAASPEASASHASSPTASASSSSPSAAGMKNGTFTGAAEETRYGPVQVAAVISGGKLTNVTILQVPDRGGYEAQIVQSAVPQLISEALAKQSADVDVVSGATYTSDGYAQSLQSALDQAGM